MHQLFKDKFKELDLSIAEVETKIGCTANYLSRFINGKQTLPGKWEKKIQEFINGIEKQLKNVAPLNQNILRPWIPKIESFCLSHGIEPEDLIEWYKSPEMGPVKPKQKQGEQESPTDWDKMSKVDKLKWFTANRK